MALRRDWPWWRIKGELESKGYTLASLAREHGFSRYALAKVRRIPIPNPQAVIAQAIGLSPKVIWPTRYTRSGRPIRRQLWLKNSTRAKVPPVKNSEAA